MKTKLKNQKSKIKIECEKFKAEERNKKNIKLLSFEFKFCILNFDF